MAARSGITGELIPLGSTYPTGVGALFNANKIIPPVVVVAGMFVMSYVVLGLVRSR
jgi:hypothetical protein